MATSSRAPELAGTRPRSWSADHELRTRDAAHDHVEQQLHANHRDPFPDRSLERDIDGGFGLEL
jgi:hypothetical protein